MLEAWLVFGWEASGENHRDLQERLCKTSSGSPGELLITLDGPKVGLGMKLLLDYVTWASILNPRWDRCESCL